MSIVSSLPESEGVKVFVHEFGHAVDIEYLVPRLLRSDASEEFYGISWQDIRVKLPKQTITNFVSGYAMTNKYEDFAESFGLYVFHNETFAARAQLDPIIARKYAFFQDRVFMNSEFVGTSFETAPLEKYLWDTTKPPISVAKYLQYIR